jgi:hypothetical protein
MAATRADGIVAGSGVATANNPGRPSIASNGVAIEEPPTPNRPISKPITAPATTKTGQGAIEEMLPKLKRHHQHWLRSVATAVNQQRRRDWVNEDERHHSAERNPVSPERGTLPIEHTKLINALDRPTITFSRLVPNPWPCKKTKFHAHTGTTPCEESLNVVADQEFLSKHHLVDRRAVRRCLGCD